MAVALPLESPRQAMRETAKHAIYSHRVAFLEITPVTVSNPSFIAETTSLLQG